MIAAVGRNGVIGDGRSMPWHLSEDLRYFKRQTMGHPMVMGRRTFDSMGALPGRRSVVVTRQPRWSHPGVETAHSLAEAFALVAEAEEVFVVGGGEISPEGSVTFPPVDPDEWAVTAREQRDGFAWVTLVRRPPDARQRPQPY
jgi:dihydrofolate reductase